MGKIQKFVSKLKKVVGRKAEKDDKADQVHLVSEQPRAASNLLAVEQAALAQAALRRSEPLSSTSKPLPPTPSPSPSPSPSTPVEREAAELV